MLRLPKWNQLFPLLRNEFSEKIFVSPFGILFIPSSLNGNDTREPTLGRGTMYKNNGPLSSETFCVILLERDHMWKLLELEEITFSSLELVDLFSSCYMGTYSKYFSYYQRI